VLANVVDYFHSIFLLSYFLVLEVHSDSGVDHGYKIQTENHGKHVGWLKVEAALIVEDILDTNNIVNKFVNSVFLCDLYSWSSKEVKSTIEFA